MLLLSSYFRWVKISPITLCLGVNVHQFCCCCFLVADTLMPTLFVIWHCIVSTQCLIHRVETVQSRIASKSPLTGYFRFLVVINTVANFRKTSHIQGNDRSSCFAWKHHPSFCLDHCANPLVRNQYSRAVHRYKDYEEKRSCLSPSANKHTVQKEEGIKASRLLKRNSAAIFVLTWVQRTPWTQWPLHVWMPVFVTYLRV